MKTEKQIFKRIAVWKQMIEEINLELKERRYAYTNSQAEELEQKKKFYERLISELKWVLR